MTVTEISPCARNKSRVNVYLDGDFGFACYIETLEDERVGMGSVLTAEDVERITSVDGRQCAWRAALTYAERTLRTEKQVADYLRRHEVSEPVVRDILKRLKSYGYIDDEEYAQLYADRMYEKYGRHVVRKKLRDKGIPAEIAERVTQLRGRDEVLVAHAEKLYARLANEEDSYKRRAKMMRSLAAKGFEFDDIRRALEALEESHST